MRKFTFLFAMQFTAMAAFAGSIVVPMDATQKNHLKAYGAVYHAITKDNPVTWLLNYKGGTYLMNETKDMTEWLSSNGISFETITDGDAQSLLSQVNNDPNMGSIPLEVAPKIAVYGSQNEGEQWDDAVVLALNYAGIPYDVIYDQEVLIGDLSKYNWIHMHHEDFTGQYGKFSSFYKNADWFKKQVASDEEIAAKYGFKKVSELKLAVAKKLKAFVANGGHLFGMCSATDSYDIALAAEGMDLVKESYVSNNSNMDLAGKLNFNNTFAFYGFKLSRNANEYEFSNIDTYNDRGGHGVFERNDRFSIKQYSPKKDLLPTILTQDHKQSIKGFWGQTTGFHKQFIKPGVIIIGENDAYPDEARYLFGEYGKGTWSFFGGHDPEDYQHAVGDKPTDLSKHPNSAGYRIILNNVFLASIKPKEEKKNALSEISLFPNPSKDGGFEVSFNSASEQNAKVRIFNLSGQLLLEQQVMAVEGANQYHINVEGIANGIYQVEFTAGDFRESRKLVVGE